MSIYEGIVFVAAIFAILYWLYGIRFSFSKGYGVTNASANLTFLWTFFLIIVLILRISTLHLLWIFPILYFLMYNVWVLAPFHIGGRLMIMLAKIGLNKQEIVLKEKIKRAEFKRKVDEIAEELFPYKPEPLENPPSEIITPNLSSDVEKPEYYSFLDARGIIFENPISTDKDYPKCVFGTDYNRGIGYNLIIYDEDYSFLINCKESDDGSLGIKSIVLEEEDQFNHFVREEMFAMIYSMIKDSDNKFQIIVGGFFPEEDDNWYNASDIKKYLRIEPELSDAKEYLKRGDDKFSVKNYFGALEDYNRAKEINPNIIEVYLKRGNAVSKLKNYRQAIIDYNRAIEINHNHHLAYNNRGYARRMLRDYEGAIKDFNEAIKINPNVSHYFYNRGLAKSMLGENENAMKDYNKSIELDPNFAEAYFMRGNLNYSLGNKSEALKDYAAVITINPKHAEAYCNIGTIKAESDHNVEAIEYFSKAIELNPNLPEPYLNRGGAKNDLGNRLEAIEDFAQALELDPNYAAAYFNRAGAKHCLGDEDGALIDLEKAAKLGLNQAIELLQKYRSKTK